MSETLPPTPGQPPVAKPPESGGVYLALSILTTLFCCLPFGIPAIVFAAQIDGRLKSGDIEGATKSARMAKIWIITSAASGFAVLIIYLIIFAAAGLTVFDQAIKNQ
jgi:predicted secreted protein